jgi:dethiobiotin synthetase
VARHDTVVLIVVTGTGTDVGKTWWTAAMLTALRAQGVPVAARKPVQSFDPGDDGPTDAHVLADASGENPERVCPPHRWLRVAMAPPIAAEVLGHAPFTIADLAAETRVEAGVITFVEGAGGVRSPLAADGDTVDLCSALRPDLVVIVADAGLGAINGVRLGAAALAPHRLAVALNRYRKDDEVIRRNVAWLRDRDGYTVSTTPHDLASSLNR